MEVRTPAEQSRPGAKVRTPAEQSRANLAQPKDISVHRCDIEWLRVTTKS